MKIFPKVDAHQEKMNLISHRFIQPFEKMLSEYPIPLDKVTTEILARLMLSEKVVPKEELSGDFICELIMKRIYNCMKLKIEDSKLILFLSLITKRPGIAVMWLTYLDQYFINHNLTEMTLDYFCEHIVPFGILSEDNLHKLWDMQKDDKGQNLLDSYWTKK